MTTTSFTAGPPQGETTTSGGSGGAWGLTSTEERLHALDNLRGVMMWLGVVLHVAGIYTAKVVALPWHDRHTTLIADLLLALIHSFRMPVFFMLAGFFVALLVQRQGLRGMLNNRLLRLGLPFVLFWPLLYILCGGLAMAFMHRMERGTWGLDPSLLPRREGMPTVNTMHLWFLWMLVWLCAFTALLWPLCTRLAAPWRAVLSHQFERLAASPVGFVAWALPLAFVGAHYKDGIFMPSGAFVPALSEWLHNGLFYVFGLVLYAHRSPLLALYQRRWLVNAGAGLVCFVAVLALNAVQTRQGASIPHYAFWSALVYNACTGLWSLAWLGLFLRYLGGQHRVMDYLSQSSYWVYLVHFPATIAFGAWLYESDLSALAKMSLNIAASTVFCLVTYQLFVRSTAIGGLLNGRRHPFTLFGWRKPRKLQSV